MRTPHDDLTFRLTPWADLTKDDLYAALQLRDVVFVVGQKITAEPEIDGRDPECAHALAYRGDTLVGTARLFMEADPVVIGRVAVRTDLQRGGYGTWMMRQIQQAIGEQAATLHAQAHLEGWYASLGWRRVGPVFYEAEIPHVTMHLNSDA